MILPTSVPLATYRLQFRQGTGFQKAAALVPYLSRLGVSHLYASPVFMARAGSPHGYDVTDPNHLDPLLGTEEDFHAMVDVLHHHGMGLLLDIVPNHMAADSENRWWWDVLTYGRESQYARFFDIDWEAGRDLQSGEPKLILPLLGRPLEDAMAAGELIIERQDGIPVLRYFDTVLPLRSSTGTLSDVLDRQAYRLAYWRSETDRPNYRRFFDINGLVGLRVEDPAVFEATHQFIRQLMADSAIDGLRIDHVDGLRDPAAYLHRLRALVDDAQPKGTPPMYLIVEKILGVNEALARGWPISGTTGYDFLGLLNGVLADGVGVHALERAYVKATGRRQPFHAEVLNGKREVLRNLFRREVESLVQALMTEAPSGSWSAKVLESAVVEVTAHLPVYRSYADKSGMAAADRRVLDRAFTQAGKGSGVDLSVLEHIRRVLFDDQPKGPNADFVLRWQQLTGPAMAKGLEDTAFYRHNRLISLNEVGGHAAPVSTASFHHSMARRRSQWPHTMNATSTHDTKRSEDVRARLNILAAMPKEWAHNVERWVSWNNPLKQIVDGALCPEPNTEWLLYQTIVGAWPLDEGDLSQFTERVTAFMVKAAREAKEQTSWVDGNHPYETALASFVGGVLDPRHSHRFIGDVARFVDRIAPAGAVLSLAQVVIKATAPGVPDFYQGSELWDFSLTDPDNRRSVDFIHRASLFDRLASTDSPESIVELLGGWRDGRIKLYTTFRLLQARMQHGALFEEGDYVPIVTSGADATRLLAFARRLGDDWMVVAVPRLVIGVGRNRVPLGKALAGDTTVVLPADAPRRWKNVLTGEQLAVSKAGALSGAHALRHFPGAVLISN